MIKTMRLQIYASVVSCLLFSACTSVTPVPTDELETPTPIVMLSTTPSNVGPTAATAQETAQSKDTGQDCPPPSKTVDIAPQYYAPAAGNSPVWAIINKPILVFSMSEIRQAPLTEHGYQYKVLWVVEKTYSDKVMLQGGNLEDRTPLWFKIGGEEPTTNPTIDPLDPEAFSNPDYSDFPSYIFIPGAGCYFIEASWDKESWQINLSVIE
jgi:hypothetical protein